MPFLFFFHNRKPAPFEHKPIYYDPKSDSGGVRGRFVQGTDHLKKRRKTNRAFRRSLFLLIVILSALIFLFYRWML
ncbi:MAG: hypothetical protein LBH61_06140 [Dysgonamonadaceae bacterium]|jgi:hypothetical protein|nr:hypothetical protein [Dysgonamonadaceae bacterium]